MEDCYSSIAQQLSKGQSANGLSSSHNSSQDSKMSLIVNRKKWYKQEMPPLNESVVESIEED